MKRPKRGILVAGAIVAFLLPPTAAAEEERPTLEESAAALGCLVALKVDHGALKIDPETWSRWAESQPDIHASPEVLRDLAARRFGLPPDKVTEDALRRIKLVLDHTPLIRIFDRILRAAGSIGVEGQGSGNSCHLAEDGIDAMLEWTADDESFDLHLKEPLGGKRRLDIEQRRDEGLLLRLECPADGASLLLRSWSDGRISVSSARKGQSSCLDAQSFEDLVRSSPKEVQAFLVLPLAEIGIHLPGVEPPADVHARGLGHSKAEVQKLAREQLRPYDTSIATLDAKPWIGRSMAFSPDGGTLAYGGKDGDVRLWETRGWTECKRLEDVGVGAVYSPDGKWLVTYGWHGGTRVFDAETLEVKRTLDRLASRVVFSPDGKRLYLAETGQDGSHAVVAVGLEDGRVVRSFEVPKGSWQDLSLAPEGNRLVCTLYGLHLVLDVENGRTEHSIERLASTCVDFGTSDEDLYLGGRSGAVVRWDLARHRASLVYYDDPCEAETLCVSPDGALLAVGDFYGAVKVCETATAKRVSLLRGHLQPVSALAWSPDGKLLASASWGEPVKVWRVRE